MTAPQQRTAATTTRFPVAVDDALRAAGWQPGRWDMRQAEQWADTLRAHTAPGGHQHAVFPAAVEVWAEFGNLPLAPTGPGIGQGHVPHVQGEEPATLRETGLAPAALRIDPLHALHAARTLTDLGRALGTRVSALGSDGEHCALLAIDAEGRVYSLDHTGDWYVGRDFDTALANLLTGAHPDRLNRT